MGNTDNTYITLCPKCKGEGKKSRGLSKKVKIDYKRAIDLYNKKDKLGQKPSKPKAHLYPCNNCCGYGVINSIDNTVTRNNYLPHIAIVGGGIGGIALAVACKHRGIPFTLFERDDNFDSRSQGYGLTLQQASKVIKALGVLNLDEGVVSTKHLVHNTKGEILGEWGNRKWIENNFKASPKRTNIHIARQTLRLKLLEQLGDTDILWKHQFLNFTETKNNKVNLHFKVDEKTITHKADVVVGADGIRSTVRKMLVDTEHNMLRYLNCIVILGICPLADIKNIDNDLLDSKTVFQTANGNERIYIMPYDATSVMWQLSFPLSEKEAKTLSSKGPKYLKKEACERIKWHKPIPEILEATKESLITGYPVYDKELLDNKQLNTNKLATLIGDAAHPMSPFKGQGANQALIDALFFAREIYKKCNTNFKWKEIGIRKTVLNDFEDNMLKRSATKVKDSANAAKFLHSENVLFKGNEPRKQFINDTKQI